MEKLYLTFLPEHEPPFQPELFSDYRLKKLAAQKNALVRRRSIVSELLLRYALHDCGFDYPAALPIDPGRQGKPYLHGNPCYFSLSHSSSAVLCALSDRELGADIQILSPANDRLMRRFYTPDEREYALSSLDTAAAFTEIWCKKESCSKADGRGLSILLSSFSVLDEAIAVRIFHTTAGEYHLAVCLAGDAPREIPIEHVENSALL